MRETPLDPHFGAEAVVRPEFVDELADRLRSELRGTISIEVRASARRRSTQRRWVWGVGAAAAVAAVVLAATLATRANRVVPAPVATDPPAQSVPTSASAVPASTDPSTSGSAVKVDNTEAFVPLRDGPELEPEPLFTVPFGDIAGQIARQASGRTSPVAVSSNLLMVLETSTTGELTGRVLLFDRSGNQIGETDVESLPATLAYVASTPAGTLVVVGSIEATGSDAVVRVFDTSGAAATGTIRELTGAFVLDGVSGPYRLEPDGVYAGNERILSQQLDMPSVDVTADERVEGGTATIEVKRSGSRDWSVDVELPPDRTAPTPVQERIGPFDDGAWLVTEPAGPPGAGSGALVLFNAEGGLAWYRLGDWRVAASDRDQLILTRVTDDGLEFATVGTVPGSGFVPACTEIAPSDSAPTAPANDAFSTFGPIGASPLLSLTLPNGRSEFTPAQLPTSASIERIPGGFLVSIRSNSSGYFPGSILLAVDDDGAIRWRRCTDTIATISVAGPNTPTDQAVIAWGNIDNSQPTWSIVSLADGTVTADLADLVERSGLGPAPTGLAAQAGDTLVIPRTRYDDAPNDLVTLDLTSMEPAFIPVPPIGGDPSALRYTATGERLVASRVDSTTGRELPVAVLLEDSWSTDPANLQTAIPVSGGYSFNPDSALEGRDGAGNVIWRRDDLLAVGGEGFRSVTTGDVVLAASAEVNLDAQRLGGYSRTDGRTLWERDGFHLVSAVGDGLAMISIRDDGGITGWELIDVSTGSRIEPDQSWAGPEVFNEECCGGTEFTRVDRIGGILAAFHPGRIDIWYPASETGTTRTVDTAS
jgi:hypothetical protein